MLNRFLCCFIVAGLWQAASAATVQLKDKAVVTGIILADKKDQVVIDLGFTVLVIPRNSIVKISEEPAPEASVKALNAPAPLSKETKKGIFSTANSALAEKSVRELVNQLGEAVVQVRTPSG